MSQDQDQLARVAEIYSRAPIVLRDVFGYITSGVLLILLVSPLMWALGDRVRGSSEIGETVWALGGIVWALLIAALAVSYVLGHVLAACSSLILEKLLPTDPEDLLENEMRVLRQNPALHTFFVERYNLLYRIRGMYCLAFVLAGLLYLIVPCCCGLAAANCCLFILLGLVALVVAFILYKASDRAKRGFFKRVCTAHKLCEEEEECPSTSRTDQT